LLVGSVYARSGYSERLRKTLIFVSGIMRVALGERMPVSVAFNPGSGLDLTGSLSATWVSGAVGAHGVQAS
jgi:methyl coenzyme M reductase subunit D